LTIISARRAKATVGRKRLSCDHRAEREGEAIGRLAGLLGSDPPETRLQRAIGQARCAAALGLPRRPHPVYRWEASCKAHARINRAPWSYLVWGPPPSKRIPDGAAERERQARKRLHRAALLLDLRYVPSRQLLDIDTASRLSGLSRRVLERAISNGRITGKTVGYRRLIPVGELKQLLAEKLAGRPIAA